MKKFNGQILLAVCWLLLAAGLVRAWGWGNYVFSPDDVMHLNIAGQPTLARLWSMSLKQFHPPLLYLVYHLALKVSRNIYWLRSISLAAGLATLMVLFFIGRKAAGDLAGIVMTALAAGSYGHILMSQVVRHYSLLLLFLSLALWFFIAWHKSPRRRYLFGFAAASLAAASTHYSGVIPLAAMGLGWLWFLAARRSPGREYLKPVLAFLPTTAALGFFFWAHVAKIFSSGFYGKMQAGYLEKDFPASVGQFADNLQQLFGYLFLPPIAVGVMALALAGLAALYRRGQKEPALAIVTTFALAVVLNLLNKYPLGGNRQCIYLLPLAALAAGAGAQWLWEWLTGAWPTHFRSPRWVTQNRLAILGLAALIISTCLLLNWFKKTDFLRRYHGQSWMEFPVTRKNYLKTFKVLLREKTDQDILITTAQTSQYLVYESRSEAREVAPGLMKVGYRGRDFYFAPRPWVYENVDQFAVLVRKLGARMDLARVDRLLLFNLGWGRGFPKKLEKTTRLEVGGGTIYVLHRPQFEALIAPGN